MEILSISLKVVYGHLCDHARDVVSRRGNTPFDQWIGFVEFIRIFIVNIASHGNT